MTQEKLGMNIALFLLTKRLQKNNVNFSKGYFVLVLTFEILGIGGWYG